jgi:hypothetical protein
VIALLWCWWRERNRINHQERCLTPAEFQFLILRHCDEWEEHIAKKPKQATSKVQHWTPPPPDVIKINLDGAFLKDTRRGGWGAIGRDHSGEPVFAACGCNPVVADALQSELLALIHAIPVAEQFGIGSVILSTDCLELKHAIESTSYDFSRLGPLFLQAKFLLLLAFSEFSIEYFPRAWPVSIPPVLSLVANDLVVP